MRKKRVDLKQRPLLCDWVGIGTNQMSEFINMQGTRSASMGVKFVDPTRAAAGRGR